MIWLLRRTFGRVVHWLNKGRGVLLCGGGVNCGLSISLEGID